MDRQKETVFPVSGRYLNPAAVWPRLVLRVAGRITEELEALAKCTSNVEQIGILGMRRKDRVITHMYLDSDARQTCSDVQPDAQKLMSVARQWMDREDEVCLAGFLHTHPTGVETLSQQDLEYAGRVMEENGLKHLLMGLVTPGRIHFYAVDNPLLREETGRSKG